MAAKAFLFLVGDTVFLFKKEKNGVASVLLGPEAEISLLQLA